MRGRTVQEIDLAPTKFGPTGVQIAQCVLRRHAREARLDLLLARRARFFPGAGDRYSISAPYSDNEARDHGRREENVRALRALFVDDDSGELTSQALELTRSITVRSKRGLQTHWLLREGEPLQRFTPAQLALAEKLGTDPTVKGRRPRQGTRLTSTTL